MRTIHNIDEANAALAAFTPKDGAKIAYTLERMRSLMTYLGNPQNKLKIIHVAGTSGKTSTCYYVAALLKSAGQKVGLTVSPHVDKVNERIQINLAPLKEQEFCSELTDFLELIDASRITPTYFELLVAMAYWQFAKQQVDYAVIEVGLGGLLDGTNVISRTDKVCVITDIALDHISVLGNTLPEIAAQKAGIISKENAVFTYVQAPEISDTIKRQCEEQLASLKLLNPDDINQSFEFLPLFQQRNFGLAKKAVDYVLDRESLAELNDSDLLEAARIRIPARMEILNYKGKTIILDGAHNAQKIQALASSVRAQFKDSPIAALIGFAANRDYRLEPSIRGLTGLAEHIIATSFASGQDLLHKSVAPEAIVDICRRQGFNGAENVPDLNQALASLLKRPEKVLLITGSFYLLYNLRPLVLELAND